MRDRDCTRFGTVTNEDKVVVPITASQDIAARPKWDAFQNNHFAMRRRLVDIFLRVANKLITRLRAGKRLEKLKHFIIGNEIRTREDMVLKVQEDWKIAQNARQTGDESENDIRNVKFTFGFNVAQISDSLQKLPLEYETNITSFMERVDANPPINFDDLDLFEPMEMLDFEVQSYSPFPIPAITAYDPPMRDHPKRPGCEYESIFRQKAGEPDLEKIQIAAHQQKELLKKDKKDIASGAIVAMPSTFTKPFDYSMSLLLRTDQHPTLREYVSMPANSTTEVDPAFSLYPSVRQPIPEVDEITLKNAKNETTSGVTQGMSVVSRSYNLGLSKTVSGSYVNNLDIPTYLLPGNFGVRVLDNMMPTNLSDVWRDRQNTQINQFTCEGTSFEVPQLMAQPKEVDYLTDEESDENKGFEVKIPNLDDLITQFEGADETIKAANESL